MMYESPIMLYQRKIADGVQLQLEDNIMKAVLAYDIKVDKDELIRALRYDREQYNKGYADGKSDAVKHGRWIPLEYDGYADGNPVYDLWECSECQEEHSGDEDTLTPYCPNCGAKMEADNATD
jgi:rubrerythrin